MNKSQQETKFSKYFNLPNPGLRAYFDNVRKGQPDEYRTTFYAGKSLPEIVDMWGKHLKSLSTSWPELLDYENDQAKKVGPMSVMKPLSERMSDIEHYYDDILLPSVPISDEAIALVCKELKSIAGLRMRTIRHTVEDMKRNTNSGAPYFTKRLNVLHKTIPCASSVSENDVYMYLGEDQVDLVEDPWYGCAVLGWRGQEGGPEPSDTKQRVVWMFPFSVNINELQVYQPLIQAIQKQTKPLVPAWVSLDLVDQEITKMFSSKHPDDVVICTDFSKFDQHFNQDMQSAALSILKYLFSDRLQVNVPGSFKSWCEEVFPIKYVIPLAYDYGLIKHGKHGMASGSGGTNADETLAHRALQHEVALLHGQKLNPHSQCLGDDGILTYPGITVDDVVQTYASHGQECNIDKQYVSKQDCIYLRRWHHINYKDERGICVGVYPTMRALGRLAEQERYYDPKFWSKEMVALRQLAILENIKYHPLKEEFVEFCMKGDKYRLGLDIPGFLSNLERIASKATKHMPDFLGYARASEADTKDNSYGIASWWIVKYLKSKA